MTFRILRCSLLLLCSTWAVQASTYRKTRPTMISEDPKVANLLIMNLPCYTPHSKTGPILTPLPYIFSVPPPLLHVLDLLSFISSFAFLSLLFQWRSALFIISPNAVFIPGIENSGRRHFRSDQRGAGGKFRLPSFCDWRALGFCLLCLYSISLYLLHPISTLTTGEKLI